MDDVLSWPAGTVTFLFTDIEGSTRLWEQHPKAMRDALSRHNALLAERAEPELQGPEQAAWFDQLETEHDNLLAALEWCRADEGGGEAGMQFAGALGRFWFVRGRWREGVEWLTTFLNQSGQSVPTVARVKALAAAAPMACYLGDDSTPLADESLALSRELGYQSGIARSLLYLGLQAWHRGDYALVERYSEESRALFQELGEKQGMIPSLILLGGSASRREDHSRSITLFEESLALSREVQNPRWIAMSLCYLGSSAFYRGDLGQAVPPLEQALALSRTVGDTDTIITSLRVLGRAAELQGEYGRAAVLGEERLALSRKLGLPIEIANSLLQSGQLAWSQGDGDRAVMLLRESLALLRESLAILRRVPDYTIEVAECLEGLAMIAVARQQPERAACLFGAANAVREARGTPTATRSPTGQELAGYEAAMAATRAALGEAAFAAAWAEGHEMTLEDAMTDALREAADA